MVSIYIHVLMRKCEVIAKGQIERHLCPKSSIVILTKTVAVKLDESALFNTFTILDQINQYATN